MTDTDPGFVERLRAAVHAEFGSIGGPYDSGMTMVAGGLQDDLEPLPAILAAIREPSEAMLSDRVIRQHGYAGDVDMVWRDMIDIAISEVNDAISARRRARSGGLQV